MYQIILRIKEEFRDELKKAAVQEEITLTGLIRQILREWLKKRN